MESKGENYQELYLVGGPRAIGKSTLLKKAKIDYDIINTGKYLQRLGKEFYGIEDREKILNNGLPKDLGKKFVEEIYEEIKKREGLVLDTHFYNKGFLGIPRENLNYMKESYKDIKIHLIGISCGIKSLMNRREKRGISKNNLETIDDLYGNFTAQKIYHEILLDEKGQTTILFNQDLDKTIEDLEKFINN